MPRHTPPARHSPTLNGGCASTERRPRRDPDCASGKQSKSTPPPRAQRQPLPPAVAGQLPRQTPPSPRSPPSSPAPPPHSACPSSTPVFHRLWLRARFDRSPASANPSSTGDAATGAHLAYIAAVHTAVERAVAWYKAHDHGLPHVASTSPTTRTPHNMEQPPAHDTPRLGVASIVRVIVYVAKLSFTIASAALRACHGGGWRNQAASALRRRRPEETGEGTCPSALGNSASWPPSPSTHDADPLHNLRCLAATATALGPAGPTAPLAAHAQPPPAAPHAAPIATPHPSALPRVARRRQHGDMPPTDAQVAAATTLIDVMRNNGGMPPSHGLTAAVAAAFGTHRPETSTHRAIAAAAYAALHPAEPIAHTPPHLRCSPRSMAHWRGKLHSALHAALNAHRPPLAHSSADLRGQLAEERGEGVAASAFCTSASQPRREAKRALVLFSGPYARTDGLAAHLRHLGYEVVCVDNDPEHGDPAHDILVDAFYEALEQRIQQGYYSAVFAAPPCSTFSVSRFYKAKLARRGDHGPPPVRRRSCPAGLEPPPPGHEHELRVANQIVDRTCDLLELAAAAGADFAMEQPADRGDPLSPHTFLAADHAPLWLHPRVRALQQRVLCQQCTFAQCRMGAPYQKYTTLMYTPTLAPWLHDWNSLRCLHSNHKRAAGGARDSAGVWSSRRTAAYPVEMNKRLAECFAQAHSLDEPPPPQGHPPSEHGSAHHKRRLDGTHASSPSPAVRVVPVSVGDRVLACVPAGGGLFSTTTTGTKGEARKSATAAAAATIPTITHGVATESVFLAGLLNGEYVVVGACSAPQHELRVCSSRAQVMARCLEFGPLAPIWCTLDAIAEGIDTDSDVELNAERERTYRAAAAAIARTLSHASPQSPRDSPALDIGAGVGGPVGRNSTESARTADFASRHARAIAADAALRSELIRVADEHGDAALAATCIAWADRFAPPPLADIPEGLRQQVRDFSTCAHLADEPFTQRCYIPATDPLPPPTAQAPCAGGWAPRTINDVLTTWAVKRIRAAIARLQEWHTARRQGVAAQRPPPLALGADAFQPRARGRIWDLRDCRADGTGAPVLLDTVTPPIRSHLHIDYLERLFVDVADRELVSMLRHGVCTHAELAPQIVIMPNLLSLYDGDSGIDEAARAARELSAFGWWQQHEFIPFAPWRCAPRGAVPRKDGGVARGIVDQGAPRTELFTRPSSEPVESLNEACRKGRERHEVKPRFSDLAHNASILLHIADTLNEPVFTIAFDFSKYFHQLWFRPDELWRMGSLLPLADDDGAAAELLSIHTEMVMSMGLTPSSDIAQRLANALMRAFARNMRTAEEQQAWQPSAAEAAWRSRRAQLPHDVLGPQDRLFDCLQYTDDPVMTIVGVKRAALAVRIWHEIISGSGLMPAGATKWQIGAGVHWLGGCCYPSLGIMWVPRDKALRARDRVQDAIDGACTAKEYQELVGFLEHVVDIGRFPRELMAYLHHPMRAGGECDTNPHGPLLPDGRRDGYLRKWRAILLNVPGASLLGACSPQHVKAPACATWHLRSDAMLESYDSAMGGCLYGAWWRFPLRRTALTIPVLELLAACVNFVVFAASLRDARHVVMEIDALASPTVLRSDRARSSGLRAVLTEFRQLPQLRPFVDGNRLHCIHCWGEGNPLGDAASRDRRNVLSSLGAALGMRMRQVRLGDDALSFIDRVLARLDAHPLTLAEREFDSTLGYPGEGPPTRSSASNSVKLPQGSPSPSLVAFLHASERQLAAAPPAPLDCTVGDAVDSGAPSPIPFPAVGTASPAPLRVVDSMLPRRCPPINTPQAGGASGASLSPVAAALASADPWCTSLLPEADSYESTAAHHRAFAAAQCARAAAERHATSMLLDRAAPPLPTQQQERCPAPVTSKQHDSSSTNSMSLAAQARAHALTTALHEEASSGGLRLADGEADHLAARLVQLLENAAATNTLRGERSNWKHWMAFCTHRNTDPFRKDVRGMDHVEYDKEVVTLALALLFIYGRMGCRRGRAKPPRPASALAVLRGIRRAHDRLGVKMADLSLATRLADALNREYIDAHGWEALQVDRVAPLTNPLIEGMIAADSIAGGGVAATSCRAMWATLAQTGFRKAEVSLGNGAAFGNCCLTRHNLRWRIGGVEVADPSAKQLRNMGEGDLAILIPPKSKCDQFGLEWGQAPIFLRFHARSPICAARALRDLELRLPRHGRQLREGTAMFVNEDGSPITSTKLDTLFKQCLREAGSSPDAAARYSPHSFRRYLACALKARGVADSTIQALLRWKTAESLKLYSFLSDDKYADLVDEAGSADVSSVRTNALPRAELLDVAGSFHGARAALCAAARAAEATAPAEDDTTADTDNEGSDDPISDEEPAPPPPAAPPPPRKRKRSRSSSAGASAAATAAPPSLTANNAVGRRVLVPAHTWPGEACPEHDGKGWEVDIEQVDRRLSAALVRFTHARTAQGGRFAKEWLRLDALCPLQPAPERRRR